MEQPPGVRRLSDELNQLDLNFDNAVILSRLSEFEKRVSDSGLSIKLSLNGEEHYFIDGRYYPLRPGQFLVVNRHQQFECEIHSEKAVEAICFYLSRDVIAETLRALAGQEPFPADHQEPVYFLEKLYAFGENELGHFLQQSIPMLTAEENASFDLPLFYYTLAEKLLRSQQQVDRRLARIPATRRSTREELYRRLTLAHQYIRENFTTDLQLDDIARAALLSKYHLLRTYKEVYGATPYRQVLDLRLQRAEALMRQDLSLEEVAFRLGFSDRRAFAKAFRKRYGKAPSIYRLENR